ncbi:MAG: hypothetical protein D6735_00150, partial [Acidobacteria bacterium]
MAWIDNRGIVTRKTWNRLVDWLDASNTCLTNFGSGAQQVIGTRATAYKLYGSADVYWDRNLQTWGYSTDGVWGCEKGRVAADYTWASLARDVLTVHAFDKFPGCTPAIWQAGGLQNYLGCIPFSYEGGNYWLWSDTHPYELGDVRDPSQYPNAFDITQPQYCDLYADMQEFVPHVYAQRRPDTGRKIKFEHGVLLPPEYYGELLLELTYPSGGSFGVEVEFLPQYIGMPPQLLRLPDGTKINVAKAKVYCSTPTYKRFLWHFERGQDGQWHPYIDENVNSETFYVPVTLKFMGVIRRPITTE